MSAKRSPAEIAAVKALLQELPEARLLMPKAGATRAAKNGATEARWAAHQLFRQEDARALLQDAESGQKDIAEALRKYLATLQKLGEWRKLAPAPSPASLDAIKDRFPHFSEVIADIERHLALARLAPIPSLCLPPMLLLGDPGVGKTRFAQELATVMGTQFQVIPMNSTTAGFIIGGLDLSWSSGRPGQVFTRLSTCAFANPIFLLDEIDKANRPDKFDVTGPLLSLLEPATARTFRDEAVPLPIDASRVLWVATANNLAAIDEPLRSRFLVREIHAPNKAQSLKVNASIYADLREARPWGSHFQSALDPTVLEALAGVTPRLVYRALLDAAGAAALAGRRQISVKDLRVEAPGRRAIGFTRN